VLGGLCELNVYDDNWMMYRWYRKTVTVVEIVQTNRMDVGVYIHPGFTIILDAEDGPARDRSLCSP